MRTMNRDSFLRSLSGFALTAALLAASVEASAQSENPAELEKPCTEGSAMACANLAVLYKHGRSVSRDPVRALTLFVRACEGGVNFACGNVGEMTYSGVGVTTNAENGAAIIRGACRRGDSWSCETLRRLGLKMPKKSPA